MMDLRCYARVDMDDAISRTSRLCERLLARIGVAGMRAAQRNILVDTGYARGHISYQVLGDEVRFGILTPPQDREGRGGVALYPAMQEMGIKRFRLWTTNPDGSIRYGVVKWLERHGFQVWKHARAGRRAGSANLAIRFIWVWGRREPWLTRAGEEVQAQLPALLESVKGTL